jgi:hypothetical protein
MQQRKNPVLIVLGVCGGCLAIMRVGGIIMYFTFGKTFKGAVGMGMNMPKFMTAMKNHNYAEAESLVDPASQQTLTEAKLQKMEEAVEKQLGPLQSVPASQPAMEQSFTPGPNGQPQGIVYTYHYTISYEKGTATATFKFKSDNVMNLSSLVHDFKLEADNSKM